MYNERLLFVGIYCVYCQIVRLKRNKMKVDNNEDCHYGRFVRMSINALRFNFISMRDERHGTGFLEKGKEVFVLGSD